MFIGSLAVTRSNTESHHVPPTQFNPMVPSCKMKHARITEVLNLKGLRAGMNKTGHTKGLTHSLRKQQNTY
jgi:hypothetical protein